MAIPIPTRLGDILLRTQALKPHQLGVALAVQRRAKVPLVKQKMARWLKTAPYKNKHHHATDAQILLEQHFARLPLSPTHEENDLRAERAKLPTGRIARVIETNEQLKERVLSGNF